MARDIARPAAPVPTMDTPDVAEVPWEARSRFGFMGALTATIGRALFRPRALFVPRSYSGGASPYGFAVLATGIGMVMLSVWLVAAQSLLGYFEADTPFESGTKMGEAIGHQIGITLAWGGAAPVWVAVWAGILQVSLAMFGGWRRWEETVRVVGYATSAMVLLGVPMLGFPAAAIGTLAIQIVGLSQVHRISLTRASLAVLLPSMLCFGGPLVLTSLWLLVG